jgi:hypothetical protein
MLPLCSGKVEKGVELPELKKLGMVVAPPFKLPICFVPLVAGL